MNMKAGQRRSATKNGLPRLNCGPGDVCCVSAALNIRLIIGCGIRLGNRGKWATRATKKTGKLAKYGHRKRISKWLVWPGQREK